MASSTIPVAEPIKVLGDILKVEMILRDGQIMLGLENWVIPKDAGLYVSLTYGPDKTVGQSNEFNVVTNEEVQSVAMLHEIAIDILSFDGSARLRKEEVIMALNSVYAQNALDLASMSINSLPQSFLPVPSLEETKQLNRFRLSFSMNALHQKTKPVDYYDKFKDADVTTDP